MKKQFTMYTDAGHGWLAIKVKDLFDVGAAYLISPYSYIRGKTAYLEEDSDATEFIRKFRDKNGENSISIKEKHTDKRSPIRSYQSYSVFAAEQVYKEIRGW